MVMLRYGLISLAPGCVRSPQDMIYYFSAKYFPAHKKQAALCYLLSTALDFPEEERMMQQSRVSISLSL